MIFAAAATAGVSDVDGMAEDAGVTEEGVDVMLAEAEGEAPVNWLFAQEHTVAINMVMIISSAGSLCLKYEFI